MLKTEYNDLDILRPLEFSPKIKRDILINSFS